MGDGLGLEDGGFGIFGRVWDWDSYNGGFRGFGGLFGGWELRGVWGLGCGSEGWELGGWRGRGSLGDGEFGVLGVLGFSVWI